MDVGGSKGLVEAVIASPIPGQWEGSSFINPESSGAKIAATVGAALGSASAARVGGGILQGKVNQGVSFGFQLAGQGNALDALRGRSNNQHDPAVARDKRRDDWALWIEVKAEAIRRMRAMLPTSDERRKEFRILLVGFRESRKLARKRLARFQPSSADLRQKVQAKLEATSEVLEAAAERKAILGAEFAMAQQAKAEVERKHEALQGRKNQVKSLQDLAIRVRKATKRDVETEAAVDKSAQQRLFERQALKQYERRALSLSVSDKAEQEARVQEELQREKAMAVAEYMAPKPKAKAEQNMSDHAEKARERQSFLVKEGGLKSLFEQLTTEAKGADVSAADEAPGASLMKGRLEEKRLRQSQHEDTEEREPPVKRVIDFKQVELPQKSVPARLEAPLPEYQAEAEHLSYSEEVTSSSKLDARDLRDDPVRLSRKDLSRARKDPERPKLEEQLQSDGLGAII